MTCVYGLICASKNLSTRLCVPKDSWIGQQNLNPLESSVRPTHTHLTRIVLETFIVVGCELTGDTVAFGQNAWGDANNATIMSVYHYFIDCLLTHAVNSTV